MFSKVEVGEKILLPMSCYKQLKNPLRGEYPGVLIYTKVKMANIRACSVSKLG